VLAWIVRELGDAEMEKSGVVVGTLYVTIIQKSLNCSVFVDARVEALEPNSKASTSAQVQAEPVLGLVA
jgi:hypothetical protein